MPAIVGGQKREIARLVDATAVGVDIGEVRTGLAQRREALAAAEGQLAEHDAVPPIVLHPHIVVAYRRKNDQLGEARTTGENAREFLPQIRDLIDRVRVKDDPADPDRASVEVVRSLAAVLALATGQPTTRPAVRTAKVVAEEGSIFSYNLLILRAN